MKVQKIKLSAYDVTWIVLDDNHWLIKPIPAHELGSETSEQ